MANGLPKQAVFNVDFSVSLSIQLDVFVLVVDAVRYNALIPLPNLFVFCWLGDCTIFFSLIKLTRY